MALTKRQRAELRVVLHEGGYDGSVFARARMVVWREENRSVPEIAELAGVSQPTVRKWLVRYDQGGLAALTDRKSTGRPPVVSGEQKARLLALTRQSPPAETGLTHWSSRELAKYAKRHAGIEVSHNFIAELWRQNELKPHRIGTFKLSKDPEFAKKVADIVGLYLDPPVGALVLSVDELGRAEAR